MYIVCPNGQGTVAKILEADFFSDERPKNFTGGVIRIVSEEPAVDVVLAAAGHRVTVVKGLETDRQIELPGALEVHVRIEDYHGPPPKPLELRLMIRPSQQEIPFFMMLMGHASGQETGMSTAFDTRGQATLSILCPGDYEATWMVILPTDGGWSGRPIGTATQVTIHDMSGDQELVLRLEEDLTALDPEDFSRPR
jgi:hypothetical protein